MTDAYYIQRKYAFNPSLDTRVDPKETNPYENQSIDLDATPDKANLITSLVKNSSVKMHAPAIDLDVPCELVPSSQLGHYHLYIHKEISWPRYMDILKTLTAAGIVEQGFCDSSLKRGYTSLRPIGKKKPGVQVRMSDILAQNAGLKHENYMLRKELEQLKEQKTSSSNDDSAIDNQEITVTSPGNREVAISSVKEKILTTYKLPYTLKEYAKSTGIGDADDLF